MANLASNAKSLVNMILGVSASSVLSPSAPSTNSKYISLYKSLASAGTAAAVKNSVTQFLGSNAASLSSTKIKQLTNAVGYFASAEASNIPTRDLLSNSEIIGFTSNVPTMTTTLTTAKQNAENQAFIDLRERIADSLNNDAMASSVRSASDKDALGKILDTNVPSQVQVKRANAYLNATQNTFPNVEAMANFINLTLDPTDAMRTSIKNAGSMDKIISILEANKPASDFGVMGGRVTAYNLYHQAYGGPTMTSVRRMLYTNVVEAEPSQNGGYDVTLLTQPINPSASDPVDYGTQGDSPDFRPVSRDELRKIILYASNNKLSGAALESVVDEWWWKVESDGAITYDGAAQLVSGDTKIQKLAKSGTVISTQDEMNSFINGFAPPAGSTGGGTVGVPVNHQYKLIKGNGNALGDGQIRGNGNAVFLVSSSGELFHVTAELASRMQAQGLWYPPEEVAQSQVDGMNLRGSLQYVEELGVLNFPPASNGYLLVRGDSTAHLGTAQLSGNGDAVYAIDTEGRKFHVTAAVAQQMVTNGTWTEPALLNQGTVDRSPVAGALASPSGGSAPLEVPVTPNTSAPVAGGTPVTTGTPASAPTTTATTDPTMGKPFELIQGNAPGTGETQLKGNGAAVYAVFADGTKLHVTAPMAAQLVANNKWSTPRMVDQTTLDALPPSGSLATINGGRAALVIPFDRTAATTTTTTTRTQNVQTQSLVGAGMATEAVVNASSAPATWTPEEVWDSQGQVQDINDPKYGYTEQQKQDIKNFIWNNGGTWAGLEQMAISYEGGVLPSTEGDLSQVITLPDTSPEAPANSSKPSDPVVAAPVASAPAEPAKIIVTDATGVARDLTNETPANQLAIQQHINGGGTFAQIDQIAAIYASGDATAIDNWERMTLTGKYSATTAYGAEYQKALNEGYTAEIAKIWCDGKFANDMQGATTSSSTPVPIMSAGQPYNPTGL